MTTPRQVYMADWQRRYDRLNFLVERISKTDVRAVLPYLQEIEETRLYEADEQGFDFFGEWYFRRFERSDLPCDPGLTSTAVWRRLLSISGEHPPIPPGFVLVGFGDCERCGSEVSDLCIPLSRALDAATTCAECASRALDAAATCCVVGGLA